MPRDPLLAKWSWCLGCGCACGQIQFYRPVDYRIAHRPTFGIPRRHGNNCDGVSMFARGDFVDRMLPIKVKQAETIDSRV